MVMIKKTASKQKNKGEKMTKIAPVKLSKFPSSAQKVRLVADKIRNQNVNSALAFLSLSPLKASSAIKKLLESALANAENNYAVTDLDSFIVAQIFVNEGMTMKRIRPRAKGRADRILKRTCHITLRIEEAS